MGDTSSVVAFALEDSFSKMQRDNGKFILAFLLTALIIIVVSMGFALSNVYAQISEDPISDIPVSDVPVSDSPNQSRPADLSKMNEATREKSKDNLPDVYDRLYGKMEGIERQISNIQNSLSNVCEN